MHAEYLVVDDCSHGRAVEAVSEDFPETNAEPALALIVEAVDAVDGRTFVVSSEEEEVVWEFDLVGEEKADDLDTLLASVDIVARKRQLELGGKPPYSKSRRRSEYWPWMSPESSLKRCMSFRLHSFFR